jgi:hypothetical protein
MLEMIVSAPMCTRSGKRSDAKSSRAEGIFGNAPAVSRTPPINPRKASRAARLALAESMKLAVGLLIGESAANAVPGLLAAMTKST